MGLQITRLTVALAALYILVLVTAFGVFASPKSFALPEPSASILCLLALICAGVTASRLATPKVSFSIAALVAVAGFAVSQGWHDLSGRIPPDLVAAALLCGCIVSEILWGRRPTIAFNLRYWPWMVGLGLILIFRSALLVYSDSAMRALGASDPYALAFAIIYGTTFLICVLVLKSLLGVRTIIAPEA